MAKAKLPHIKTVITCHCEFKRHANSSISFLWGSTSGPVEITMLTFLKVFMVTGWKGGFFHYISITSVWNHMTRKENHICVKYTHTYTRKKKQLIKYISISTNFSKTYSYMQYTKPEHIFAKPERTFQASFVFNVMCTLQKVDFCLRF